MEITRTLIVLASLVAATTSWARKPSFCPQNDKDSLNSFRDYLASRVVGKPIDVQKDIISCYGEDVDAQPSCVADIFDDVNRKIFKITDTEMENAAKNNTTFKSETDLPEEFQVRDDQPGVLLPPTVLINPAQVV